MRLNTKLVDLAYKLGLHSSDDVYTLLEDYDSNYDEENEEWFFELGDGYKLTMQEPYYNAFFITIYKYDEKVTKIKLEEVSAKDEITVSTVLSEELQNSNIKSLIYILELKTEEKWVERGYASAMLDFVMHIFSDKAFFGDCIPFSKHSYKTDRLLTFYTKRGFSYKPDAKKTSSKYYYIYKLV